MNAAYLELDYRRVEDGVPVTLVAALPAVRALNIGGDPGDLRLPGLQAEAVYARIEPGAHGFRLVASTADSPLRLNDQPIPEGGAWLQPYDVITVDRYRLTVQEGEVPSEPARADTHLRWQMPLGTNSGELELYDAATKPYVEEFELSVRPLLHAEAYEAVQRRTEEELRRLLHSGDDTPEGYSEFLWWTRLRLARERSASDAGEIARQAYDLFPQSRIIGVSCGITYLTERNWPAAQTAFERVLRPAGRKALIAVHDARIGRVLTTHLRVLAGRDPELGAMSLAATAARPWTDIPHVTLNCPGDEVLLWRTAWHGRVFGASDDVRFLYFGPIPGGPPRFRWEIHDIKRHLAWRRVLELPPLPLVDPSLLLEVGWLRETVAKQTPFAQRVLDRSSVTIERPPVLFDPTALALLPQKLTGQEAAYALLRHEADRLCLEMVAQPAAQDVTYVQDNLYIALEERVALRFGGSTLLARGRTTFELRTPAGQTLSVRYRGPKRRFLPRNRVQLIASLVLLIVALMALLNAAFRL